MASWPATLPQLPLAADHAEAPPDIVLRTQMEVGPAKLRRRTTAGASPLTAGFILNETQVATLRTFYESTLSGGALPFDWLHPRTGAAISCRFLEPPGQSAPSAGFYHVICRLEVMP